MTKPNRSARVLFIFVTIFLDSMGVGLVIPVLPEVIRRFETSPADVNHVFGYFISSYALMQFLASPVLGSLSDRFGRRSILLSSLLGQGLDYLLMAFAGSLPVLFIGRVIAGLTGASMTVASSYMADISNDTNRSGNFGMIGAAWGAGFIAGPLLGGLLGTYGATVPFIGAAILTLLNFSFGLFVLPESLPAEKRRAFTRDRLNPFASLTKVLRPSPISGLIIILALLILAGNVHPSIWTLYTQEKFKWSSAEVGLSLAFVGLTISAVQGFLTRPILAKLGEKNTLNYGIPLAMFGMLGFAFASRGWMIYPIMSVYALSAVVNPSLQSRITARTPANEQGELQGSIVSIASVASIIAPLLYTTLFAEFTDERGIHFSGVAYFAAAIIVSGAFVLWRIQSARLRQ